MIHETEEGFIDKTCFGIKKTSLFDQTITKPSSKIM